MCQICMKQLNFGTAVLLHLRSLVVNLALQIWKSGQLDFGWLDCWTVGPSDHLIITMFSTAVLIRLVWCKPYTFIMHPHTQDSG